MKRLTRPKLVEMNAQLELEASALRILTTCLLNFVPPFAVADVQFYSDENTDYRETWSHYRPDAACGGAVLIEQFERETDRRLAHRVVLGGGAEMTAMCNGSGGQGRAELARRIYENQFDAVGVS